MKLRILEKQSGLIGARLAGAEWSTSDIIVFLDAHCEATIGWLEPMAQKIKDNPKAIVIPSIDGIDDRTIAFHGSVVSFENLSRFQEESLFSAHFSIFQRPRDILTATHSKKIN